MGESHEHLLKVVRHCQESLDKYTEHRNEGKLLHYLEKLYRLPIKVIHLEQTGVGRTVNGLRKLGGDVGDSAKSLVAKWKEMVVGEQEEEDDEDEEEDEEDDEDGYQTGEEQSSDSDEKDNRDTKIKDTSSSHRKSDSNRTGDKNSESGHSSEKRKEKDRHHKHNGHAKHKSHKRKSDDESSDDDRPKKRPKKSEDEERHKHKRSNDSDSEVEVKHKEKKHKTDKHREREKEEHTPSRSKDKHRESSSSKDKSKHSSNNSSSKKEDSKKHEHKKSKDKDKKSKHKEKHREENKTKDSKSKSLNSTLSFNGIDSGSGASFAEALGMCEPSSSSKNTTKKKSSDKRESSSSSSSERKEKTFTKTTEDSVPKLLKEPTLDPIDINISSLLPTITPNYRPLGNLIGSDHQPKKIMSEAEALASIITSKNQRTKVYSGNKVVYSKVPSLFEICIRVLQDNIDALEYTGGVPYNVLKPILEKANPNQLYMMEHHNPYLIEETDELWQLHCQKDFRNKKREELETWREMYLRCLDERDAKLKALTANIKQSQDKSLPVRMTKLAYVDAVAKPPRNIARKQAKNGTAFEIRKPAMTPSARLNSLATAGEAGKVAVPNPGSRAVERASSHAAVKVKKAPLMLKSISSFKNRFKR